MESGEQRDDRVPMNAIGLSFELIHARGQFEDSSAVFQRRKRLGDPVSRVADDLREAPLISARRLARSSGGEGNQVCVAIG